MGIKLGGNKILQSKLNGKFLWSAKNRSYKVWNNDKFPAEPVLELQEIPDLYQNNSNVTTETRVWSCIPFTVDTSEVEGFVSGKWSIISQSGFSNTLVVNEDTGEVRSNMPSTTDSGGTCKFTLKYTMTTRHGVVSVSAEASTTRIVAPYVALDTSLSIATIDVAVNSVMNMSGSESLMSSSVIPGLNVTKVNEENKVTITGTPTHLSNNWGLTNGTAIPQSIVLSNGAGEYECNWTVERREFPYRKQYATYYNLKVGSKVGIISATSIALTGILSSSQCQMLLFYDSDSTLYTALSMVGNSSWNTGALTFDDYLDGKITSFLSLPSVWPAWTTISGSRRRVTSTCSISTSTDKYTTNPVLIVGVATVTKEVYMRLDWNNTTDAEWKKHKAALENSLYITG